jgi:hypothetical protein
MRGGTFVLMTFAWLGVSSIMVEYPMKSRVNDIETHMNSELLTLATKAFNLTLKAVSAETRHREILKTIEDKINGYENMKKQLDILHASITSCQDELNSTMTSCVSCLLNSCSLDTNCVEDNLDLVLLKLGQVNPDWMQTLNKISVYNFSKDFNFETTIPLIDKVHEDVNSQTRLILLPMYELIKQPGSSFLFTADLAAEFQQSQLDISQFFNDLRLIQSPQQLDDIQDNLKYEDSLIREVHDLVNSMGKDRIRIDGKDINVRYPAPIQQDKSVWDLITDKVESAWDSTVDVTSSLACGAKKFIIGSSCGRNRRQTTCDGNQLALFQQQFEECIASQPSGTNCRGCLQLKSTNVKCRNTLERDMSSYTQTVTEMLLKENNLKQQLVQDQKSLEDNLAETHSTFQNSLWIVPFCASLGKDKPAVKVTDIMYNPSKFNSNQGSSGIEYTEVAMNVVMDGLSNSQTTIDLPPVNVHDAGQVGKVAADSFLNWYRSNPQVKQRVNDVMKVKA